MSRKLDVAIAEALGYELLERQTDSQQIWINRATGEEMLLPGYTTDGNAMLELDAEMRARGFVSWVSSHIIGGRHKFAAEYFDPDNAMGDYKERMARANTEPLARALAAYKALTGEDWQEVKA